MDGWFALGQLCKLTDSLHRCYLKDRGKLRYPQLLFGYEAFSGKEPNEVLRILSNRLPQLIYWAHMNNKESIYLMYAIQHISTEIVDRRYAEEPDYGGQYKFLMGYIADTRKEYFRPMKEGSDCASRESMLRLTGCFYLGRLCKLADMLDKDHDQYKYVGFKALSFKDPPRIANYLKDLLPYKIELVQQDSSPISEGVLHALDLVVNELKMERNKLPDKCNPQQSVDLLLGYLADIPNV